MRYTVEPLLVLSCLFLVGLCAFMFHFKPTYHFVINGVEKIDTVDQIDVIIRNIEPMNMSCKYQLNSTDLDRITLPLWNKKT